MKIKYLYGLARLLCVMSLIIVTLGHDRVAHAEPPMPTPSDVEVAAFPGTAGSAFLPFISNPQPPPKAFPSAEGFGADTTGGRGGAVIEVTNLNDSGAGSLRACAEASGPRTCVFRVAGTIELTSSIEVKDPYLTIAGQSAPGGGITLKAAESVRDREAYLKIRTHEVIIRYLRLRPGTKGENARALSMSGTKGSPAHHIVIDHNSLSWAGDELLIAWDDTRYVTFSWNNVSESLPNQPMGSTGLKGPLLGEKEGGFYSFHHNLVAHHTQRSPSINAGAGPTDVVNNVMYNVGKYGSTVKGNATVNFVGNAIKAGPNTRMNEWIEDLGAGGIYLGGSNTASSHSNLLIGTNHRGEPLKLLPAASQSKVRPRFDAPAVTTFPAQEAFTRVLDNAGAIHGLNCDGTWFSRPDAVDTRIVQSVKDGTRGHNLPVEQTFSQLGYISIPEDAGGWPTLAAGTPCADSDHDGMPNEWESLWRLDPNVANHNGDADGDGYTNLEEYLNGTKPVS